MPVPKVMPQSAIKVNDQWATDLGREPRIVKVWRQPLPELPPPPMTDAELKIEVERLTELRYSGKATAADRAAFHETMREWKRRGFKETT